MSEASNARAAPPEMRARLVLVQLSQHLRPALWSVAALTLLTGVVFPLAIFGLGRGLFPDQANGSLLTRGGVVVGSRLIGQGFNRPGYFQGRPSAAGAGYDATQSGGTNLAPANPKLASSVATAAAEYRTRNGLGPRADVPIDAVTSSASGLDPDISPANAALQIRRVAVARGWSEASVRDMVVQHTSGRDLYFMGAPRVSVLELNLALDRRSRSASR